MEGKTTRISPADIDRQREFCDKIQEAWAARPSQPLAYVDTYGCQQNEADSERIRGYLTAMGCGFTDDEKAADVIVINTCAIREHAEDRVFGNVGALVHAKRAHPGQIICLCGCMAQEPRVAEKLRQSYRHVDLVFGPHALWKFPELLYRVVSRRGRVFETTDEAGSIAEGIPLSRQDGVKAWVSIMYGCNNFCTYCIVPYVRGRERSRLPEDVLAEIRALVEEGYRDITLLGQNVNSYGKDLGLDMDFADLLEKIEAIPGDFLIRFMTSHPKDASQKLFEVMGKSRKIAPVFHLPVQAGNDRVLKAMNRVYTREEYLDKVRRLRDREHPVSFPVFFGYPEAVLLGNGIGAVGMKGCFFTLRDLLHFSVKFRGRCLINSGFLFQPQNPYRFKDAQNTDSIDFAGIFRHIKGNLNVGLCSQVVEFIRTNQADNTDQRGGVG